MEAEAWDPKYYIPRENMDAVAASSNRPLSLIPELGSQISNEVSLARLSHARPLCWTS